MTQFSPELPPSPSQCRFCNRPLGMVHYRVNGQPVCDPCSRRVMQMLELNEFRGGPYTVGLLYGLAAAILCGFGWAVIVKITHAEIGIIAAGIGYVVARAILIGSNGRRGKSIQVTALILSLAGVFIGKGFIAAWVLWDHLSGDLHMQGNSLIPRAIVFLLAPFLTFQFFDLIWYGIAAYQAWRMTQPVRLNIEGPIGNEPPPLSWQVAPQTPYAGAPTLRQSAPAAPQRSPRSTPLPQAILITLVTAAISAFVYAGEEGWKFAVGSVLCIMIHELGHTVACLLYGLPASSPIFIPYVGALISLRAQPPNAKVESVIGIAGPVGGLLATIACFIWYRMTGSTLAAELVQFGGMINLFNLLPIHPLDGGRIARGVAPAFWIPFVVPLAAFCGFSQKIGIRREVAILLAVITVVGIARCLQRRRGAYYDTSNLAGWTIGLSYLGVAAALMWMWSQAQGVASIF